MILCRLYQWLWSRAYDEGKEFSSWSARHIERCARCAEATAAMARVDHSLQQQCDVPPEEWHEALMRELQRVPSSTPVPLPLVRPFRVALTAVFVICGALVVRQVKSPKRAADQEMRRLPEISIVAMVGDVTGGSLERESTILEHDAMRAMELATSMLPF